MSTPMAIACSHVSDGDEPLAGVTIELLNEAGDVVATTVTDENGKYEFTNLKPGEYSIRQSQPEDLFTGGEKVGDGGGIGFRKSADRN